MTRPVLEKRLERLTTRLAAIERQIAADRSLLAELIRQEMAPIRRPLTAAPEHLLRDLELVRRGQKVVYTYHRRDVGRLAALPKGPHKPHCIIPVTSSRWSIGLAARQPAAVSRRIATGEPVVMTHERRPRALLVPPSWETP